MAINNIQNTTGTSQAAYVERIKPTNNTQETGKAELQLHPQQAWGGVSNINLNNIMDMFRKNRPLASRFITIDTNQSAYAIPLEALDDVHKKLLGLVHGGHLKTMSQALLSSLRRRKNQRFNIIDDNLGEIKNNDDDLDSIKIKRKEGTSIDEGQVNDVITQMLKENNNPTQRFLLISMTLQQHDLEPKLKPILENMLAQEINTHGKEISAKVNSSNEAAIFGQNNTKKITQFSNIYYSLLSSNHIEMLKNIISAVTDMQEFSKMTNLMLDAANNDLDKKHIPTSDPNTIHDVISFMNERSKIISLYEGMTKLLKACKLPLNLNKSQTKVGGHLIAQPHPSNII